MTLLYYDPIFRDHATGNHPENAQRILPIIRHLHFVALDVHCTRPKWRPVTLEQLGRVHTRHHIENIREFAAQGGGYIDPDTVVSPRSHEVALMAAGAVCDAVQRVAGGEDRTAFCLVRPPGHHALPDHAMGFCLFNNIAIGARLATATLGLERVLIVDWDVHHGNGTQAIFWEDPGVAYFSIHRHPFYPGTGEADETGVGAGRGTTLNLPIRFGTPRQQQLELFQRELERFAGRIRPQLVLVSAGFDSHRLDPIGSLQLETEDFATLTRMVQQVAADHAGGRIVSVLEGGYNPQALLESVEEHLQTLVHGDS